MILGVWEGVVRVNVKNWSLKYWERLICMEEPQVLTGQVLISIEEIESVVLPKTLKQRVWGLGSPDKVEKKKPKKRESSILFLSSSRELSGRGGL